MAYELIPGLRQDHRRRTYQLARYPNGKLIAVPAAEPELSARAKAAMEPVLVESQGKRGTTYQSLLCYQGASA